MTIPSFSSSPGTHAGRSKASWRTQLTSRYRSSAAIPKRHVVWNPFRKTYLMKSTVVISERNSDIWTHDIGFAQVFSSWEEADNAAKILAKMVGFDVYVKQHE